jgi:hypothetical protein
MEEGVQALQSRSGNISSNGSPALGSSPKEQFLKLSDGHGAGGGIIEQLSSNPFFTAVRLHHDSFVCCLG